MVRVGPEPMFAAAEPVDPVFEVVEGEREMVRVAAGGVETKSGGAEHADLHQGQHSEPNEGWLLSQLVDREIPGGEHRDAVAPVDGVVALRVGSQDIGVKLAAADNDNVGVAERVTAAEVTPLRHLWPTMPETTRLVAPGQMGTRR